MAKWTLVILCIVALMSGIQGLRHQHSVKMRSKRSSIFDLVDPFSSPQHGRYFFHRGLIDSAVSQYIDQWNIVHTDFSKIYRGLRPFSEFQIGKALLKSEKQSGG
ncbi:uncharacterized protein LOC131882124 [Tigriopus californicus]|uniref:uncharacterized protein LOC131882124 n=1 Tax=Tigriopus californicus TaxID=6832 RepID=UPI0027D9F0AE|nr:uncharacterized protein LOC131882124 [Tigriopus californicus]